MKVAVDELKSYRKELELLLQGVPLLSRKETPTVVEKTKPSRAELKKQRAKDLEKKLTVANQNPKGKKTQTKNISKPTEKRATETILFNKLAVSEKDLKSRSRLPKDPKHALVALEKKRAALKGLAAENPQAAAAVSQKNAWSRAIDKAQGVSVRDDARLLKKSLARKQKAKERGKKRWAEHKQNIEEERHSKAKKRRDNIQARKEANKTKKTNHKKHRK